MKRAGLIAAAVLMFLVTGCDSNNSYSSYSSYGNSYNNSTQYTTTAAATVSTLSAEELIQQYREDVVLNSVEVTYEQISRSTDGMEGSYIWFCGEIEQVLETDDEYQGLVNMNYVGDEYWGYYTDSIYYRIPKSFVDVRPLKGDLCVFWGESEGLVTYTNVLDVQVTVPCIDVAAANFFSE